MKPVRVLLALLASFLLVACASGPKLAEMKSSIQPAKADQGRIYFYRASSMFGAAIQPSISLNGSNVGTSVPGGFFFVDRAPGAMEVSTSTEVEKRLTFTLEAGQVRYVRTSIGFGVLAGRVYPELIDNATAENEMADASYTGTPLAK